MIRGLRWKAIRRLRARDWAVVAVVEYDLLPFMRWAMDFPPRVLSPTDVAHVKPRQVMLE